ncbi:hypothetical protein N7G274_010907 [Stereocaulon virgatum]|uniref:Uncharacterized protein n=1 Tax=Stereocaulon virgatum TaxID=373712 RepID=A0ABR3ZSQ0_9LECA
MEENANKGKPFDGEVYREIRKYQSQKQPSLEMQWWTLLSHHRARNLKQLLRHREFTLAFDAFLEIPALLTGMRISTLHKIIAIRCDEEIVHYLRYIKRFWSELLLHDKTAMNKLDQATVETLQLTAPWASALDAKILRGKMLDGEIFGDFSQQEREEIWVRLQSFRGLVPSLFEIFENVKCLEAWADCLKWLSADSALAQDSEATVEAVPASLAHRVDLGRRQLYAFAMRYHCEIPKRPSGKDLLAKPRATSDTTRLREMADLAHHLGFESSEIAALKHFPKSTDSMVERASEKPALVTDGPGEIRKYRCGMPRAQSYEEDRKFLFINHLHDHRDEQSKAITSYFRLRSTYLKFFGIPDDSNPEVTPISSPTPSVYLPREDPTQGLEHMEVDGENPEDITMQDGEGEEQQQRTPFHIESALA